MARLGGDAPLPAATVACGVVITGRTIASAVLLAHIVAAGVITDPAARTLGHWLARWRPAGAVGG